MHIIVQKHACPVCHAQMRCVLRAIPELDITHWHWSTESKEQKCGFTVAILFSFAEYIYRCEHAGHASYKPLLFSPRNAQTCTKRALELRKRVQLLPLTFNIIHFTRVEPLFVLDTDALAFHHLRDTRRRSSKSS